MHVFKAILYFFTKYIWLFARYVLILPQIPVRMKVKDVTDALEQFAPLPMQDDFDNAGLQVGLTAADEVTGALLCLDVTEEVVAEAAERGLNMIIAHHPLLFHPLRRVADDDYVQRCVVRAVREGIAIYAAHTNLDNVVGGVNWEMAARLGLQDVQLLTQRICQGRACGAGIIGQLPTALDERTWLEKLKTTFNVQCLKHNAPTNRQIRRVALCGGAGAFLLKDAIAAEADSFVTGEFHYHDWFGHNHDLLMVEMGHYESEQYTIDLLGRLLAEALPTLHTEKTKLNTNPINIY